MAISPLGKCFVASDMSSFAGFATLSRFSMTVFISETSHHHQNDTHLRLEGPPPRPAITECYKVLRKERGRSARWSE